MTRELRYMGHALNDSRHGMFACAVVASADWYAERVATKVKIHDAALVKGEP